MKQVQRNLLILLTAAAALWLAVRGLPLIASLSVLGALLLLLLVLALWGRDFIIGRVRARRRQWDKALARYQKFERRLLTRRGASLLLPIYMNMYSFDGVAITRNHIGLCFMHLKQLDEASRWLRAALQGDPLFALPYVNLGIIACWQSDRPAARRHLQRAVDLGFSPRAAQLLLQKEFREK